VPLSSLLFFRCLWLSHPRMCLSQLEHKRQNCFSQSSDFKLVQLDLRQALKEIDFLLFSEKKSFFLFQTSPLAAFVSFPFNYISSKVKGLNDKAFYSSNLRFLLTELFCLLLYNNYIQFKHLGCKTHLEWCTQSGSF